MFLIKLPKDYVDQAKIEKPFKELSLAYQIEHVSGIEFPLVMEGQKRHDGEVAIHQLIEELQDYYGVHYNCSCAR